MAATEGDLTGLPGVCLAPAGAAAGNVVGGVARALFHRAPLVLITPRPSRGALRLGAGFGTDHLHLFHEVTKAGASVTAPRMERLFAWAWERALAAPRGPVHLDLPADEAVRGCRRRGLEPAAAKGVKPSPSAVRAAARLLARRGRALVVVGQGCRDGRNARALRELAEHLGAPVLTTARAKGVLAEDHPLSAGVMFGGRADQEFLGKAQAVLAVGVDAAELLPRPWACAGPVVSLDEYAAGPRPFDPATQVVADLAPTLAELRQSLPPAGEWGLPSWARRAGEFRAGVRRALAAPWDARGGVGLPPHRVVQIAREVLPRETVVSVEGGAHAPLVAAFWDAYEPQRYLDAGGMGGSGYALPAAIAARLVEPTRPVVAFTGEEGLLLTLADLATASRLGLPMIVVVFWDGALGLVRAAQEQQRYAPVGVSFAGVEIPRLGDGVDALVIEVADEDALRGALEDAAATPKPALVAVRVRPSGYRRMFEILRGKSAD
jgi:acetolactate synthase-1/2/3 large subunit